MQRKTILITGGAGFIGSHLVKYMVDKYPIYDIHVIDSLTYAGNKKNLEGYLDKITFYKYSISNKRYINNIFDLHRFDGVINLAAETHVDNSIEHPDIFLQTNVIGTQTLINASLKYGINKFVQVSTDEVYGSLDFDDGRKFYEFTPFDPSSPYSASKAASDFLVLAAHKTFNLPACVTHCSNNYGPNQHAEKLIPKVIECLKNNTQIPIYGDGENIRDWVHVNDHVRAIDKVFHSGKNGERYNVGGENEMSNLDLVKKICNLYDNIKELEVGTSSRLMSFVGDRPGHDLRYSVNFDKIYTKLRWKPEINFNLGMKETIKSYL
jgi:dTDP-glucose 4,6-dehydratase